MPEDIIDKIVDRPSLNSDKDFVTKLIDELVNQIQRVKGMRIEITKAANLKEVAELIKKLETATNALTKAQNEATKAALNAEKQRQQQLKTDQEVLKLMQQEERQMQQEIKTRQARKKEIDAEKKALESASKQERELYDDYKQLNKAYNEAAAKAKSYYLVLGENHPSTVQAVKDAKDLYNILYKVDQAVGQNQRNVGNYKSAFDGLGMSFNQVARELPALAISTQAFMLAISNNFPMVVDEIGKAKAEVAALRAAGDMNASVTERIVKSLFSWNMALNVVIAALTLFGPKLIEMISGLFDAEAATRKQEMATKALNDAMRQESELIREIHDAYKMNDYNVNILEKELALHNANNGSVKDRLALEYKLAEIKQRNAFDKMDYQAEQTLFEQLTHAQEEYAQSVILFQRAMAENGNDLEDSDVKNAKARMDAAKEVTEVAKGAYEKQKGYNKDYVDAATALAAKDVEIKAFAAEEARKVLLNSIRENAQTQIAANGRLLANEQSTLDQRIKALESSAEQRKKIIKAERDNVLNDPRNQNADGSLSADALNAIKSANEAIIKENEDLFVALRDVRKQFYIRDLKATIDAENERIQAIADGNKKLADNEVVSLDQRLLASQKYNAALIQLENNRYILERKLAIESGATKAELEAIEARHLANRQKLNVDFVTEFVRLYKQMAEQAKDGILRVNDAQVASMQKYADGVKALNAGFEAGILSEKEYNKARAKIDDDFAQESIKTELDKQKQLVSLNILTGEERKAALIKIADLEKQLSDLGLKRFKKNEEEKRAELLKTLQLAQQITSDIMNVIGEAINNQVIAEKDALQGQINQINEKSAQEIEGIQNSTIAEEEKARKIQIIQASQEAQVKQLQDKQRQADNKKAAFDKAKAISDIVFNTAAAVVKALPNIPLSILVGAIGAAQLAVVASRPIPKYADGTENHPGGAAWVGDGGEHEVVKTPGGKAFLTPDTDTLMNLPAGTKVFPSVGDYMDSLKAASMRSMIMEGNAGQYFEASLIAAMRDEIRTLRGEMQQVKKSIDSKPVASFTETYAGVQKRFQTNQGWQNIINKMRH